MEDQTYKTYLRSDMREALESAAIGIYVLLILIIIALFSQKSEAKTIFFGKNAEMVRLTAGAPTLLRFPREVKNVLRGEKFTIKPASEENPNYAVLSVEPRFTTGSSEVLFLLADGQTVSLRLVIVPKTASAETNYTFEPNDEGTTETEKEETKSTSEVELLKAMVRGDKVSGYKVSEMNRDIVTKYDAKIKLIRLYMGSDLTGYIFKVKNESWRKELKIDVRDLSIGKPSEAILSQIDDATLTASGKPGSETYLRIVAKSGSSSSGLIVPMNEVQTKTSSSAGAQ